MTDDLLTRSDSHMIPNGSSHASTRRSTLLARIGVAALACFGALAGDVAALAQQDLDSLTQLRNQLNDASISPEQRMEAVQKILHTRRLMIQNHPADAERALWMADQAGDLLFELLPLEATDLTAMFGMLSPQQRERAGAAAEELLSMATGADREISQAILAIESAPNYQSDAALQQRRRELAETQRDRRIPFLRGAGSLLHGIVNEPNPAEQRRMFQASVQLLTPLTQSLEGAAAIEARLYAGLAHARLGDFDAAESLFAAVAKDASASPKQIFTARMGGVINRTMRGGPRSGLESLASIEQRYDDAAGGKSNFLYRLLMADHGFLLRRELAMQADAPTRVQAWVSAFQSYTDLYRTEAAASRDALRAIVFARLTNALAHSPGMDVPLEQLPGMVTVAYAEQLSRDESQRANAIELLETSLRERELDAEAHASALFVLGRALFEHGQRLFAARRFLELATRHPADPQAQRAIEAAVTIAVDLRQSQPNDAEAAATLREGLRVLLEKYPNLRTIDRWRYAAGRLALDELRFDDAEAQFRQITPEAMEWPDAHFMQAAVCRARAAGVDGAELARRLHEKTRAMIDRVKPVIEASLRAAPDPARMQSLSTYLAMLRIYRADALRQLDQPQQALAELANMERESSLDSVVMAELLKVRIAAYESLKQPEAALQAIQTFVRESPAHAAGVLGPMLESMHRDVQALVDAGESDQAAALAHRTSLPAAKLLEEWLESGAGEMDSRLFRLRIAQAYLAAGQPSDALARFGELLNMDPNAAEALRGKAEALFALNTETQLAQAMTIYKRLAAAGPAVDPAMYWLAQLRMLQIVDRVDRHAEQIVPRIERLRQQDRELGGERFRREFDALRMKHARSS